MGRDEKLVPSLTKNGNKLSFQIAKYKITSDVSVKTLVLLPVQDNTIFAYNRFFKICEKQIPKMCLYPHTSGTGAGYIFHSAKGLSLSLPMEKRPQKSAT